MNTELWKSSKSTPEEKIILDLYVFFLSISTISIKPLTISHKLKILASWSGNERGFPELNVCKIRNISDSWAHHRAQSRLSVHRLAAAQSQVQRKNQRACGHRTHDGQVEAAEEDAVERCAARTCRGGRQHWRLLTIRKRAPVWHVRSQGSSFQVCLSNFDAFVRSLVSSSLLFRA